jgi:hypothetical protein
VAVQSEHPIVLLVGGDPDVLFLRATLLASAGIWSMRVRNADQSIELLSKVPCDLVVICCPLDQEKQQQLTGFLLSMQPGVKVLWMLPGDDCSGTDFLMKVEKALEERPPAPRDAEGPRLPASAG